MELIDDDLKAGEGHYKSGREGPRGRTFHCRVGSITRASGGARRAVAGLDYDARQGTHSGRRDELEAEGGRSREEMAAILEAAETANPRKNGKVALDLEIELPIQATEEQRRRIVERVAAWFEAQGCSIHWAIHSRNSAKRKQPHFHATVTARPVRLVDGRWVGTSPGRRSQPGPPAVIDGPEAMAHFRRRVVATAIQDVTGLGWHGGRLEETGINRPAKARLPMAVYKADQARQAGQQTAIRGLDHAGPTHTNQLIDAERFGDAQRLRDEWVAANRAALAQRQAERQARRLMRIEALGAVDKDVLRRAAAEGRLRVNGTMMMPADVVETEIDRLRQATARQAAMIVAMARESGVEISADQLERLDGGDLVAAVRQAKAGDRTAFEGRIAAAETRAAEAGGAVMDKDREKRRMAMFEQMTANAPPSPPLAPTPVARTPPQNQSALRAAPKEPLAVPQSMGRGARTALASRLAGYTADSLVELGEITARHYRQLMSRHASSMADARAREEYHAGALMVVEQIRAAGREPGAELSRLIAPRRSPAPSPGSGRGRSGNSR